MEIMKIMANPSNSFKHKSTIAEEVRTSCFTLNSVLVQFNYRIKQIQFINIMHSIYVEACGFNTIRPTKPPNL